MTKASSWTALALTLSLGHGQASSPQVTSTPAPAQRAVTPSKPPAPNSVTRNSAAPATPGNAPVVKTGLQTIFTTNQLTGNSAVKMTASTNYQIVLVFPSRIQSIGINASKQDAVLASIDNTMEESFTLTRFRLAAQPQSIFVCLRLLNKRQRNQHQGRLRRIPIPLPSFSKCWWTSRTRGAACCPTPSRTRPPGQPRPQPPNHLCRP